MSSCYDACSIGGVLLASSFVTLMSAQGRIEEGWRYLFWTGGLTALIGIFLRGQTAEVPEFVDASTTAEKQLLPVLRKYIQPFIGIFFAAGFSYTTYSLAFTLMNGFIPLVTSLSKTQIMKVNTWLLIWDMLLLPAMGYLASRFGKEKVMISGAASSVFFAIPMFYLLDQASLGTVIAVRLLIISCGVAFSAPYYAWAMEQVPSRHRYLILSLAGALGSQLIGMPTSAICLWLYKIWGGSWAPSLYLQATGTLAGLAVFLLSSKNSCQNQTNFTQ